MPHFWTKHDRPMYHTIPIHPLKPGVGFSIWIIGVGWFWRPIMADPPFECQILQKRCSWDLDILFCCSQLGTDQNRRPPKVGRSILTTWSYEYHTDWPFHLQVRFLECAAPNYPMAANQTDVRLEDQENLIFQVHFPIDWSNLDQPRSHRLSEFIVSFSPWTCH